MISIWASLKFCRLVWGESHRLLMTQTLIRQKVRFSTTKRINGSMANPIRALILRTKSVNKETNEQMFSRNTGTGQCSNLERRTKDQHNKC